MEPKNNRDEFTERVRAVVKEIQRGKTMSYKEVATRAGNAQGARAVARIMSLNYDPSIPCHRVIYANGTIGGYNRGGEKVKMKLLEEEHSDI